QRMCPPYTAQFLVFFHRMRRQPTSTLFPYTTLFRSELIRNAKMYQRMLMTIPEPIFITVDHSIVFANRHGLDLLGKRHVSGLTEDRKSTRLNSSHVKISYAVFCLKKKKQHEVVRHGQ